MNAANLGGWERILPLQIVQRAMELSWVVQRLRDDGKEIYPEQEKLFQALLLTPPQAVKVVILGQDPYHEPGQAQGLAFSVPFGFPKPPSLRNIHAELAADLQLPEPESGDLTHWAKQGVLLLNTVLSVERGAANSHAGIGWQEVTNALLAACCRLPQPVIFVLWGSQARMACEGLQIDQGANKVSIHSAHPSPLSAYRGFFGSRPFSAVNRFLALNEQELIRW